MAALPAEKAKQAETLLAQAAEMEKTLPTKEVPMACAVKEGPRPWIRRSSFAATITIWASRWNATVPAILSLRAPAPEVKTKSGRLELADWIVDPRNPLPSRVMANRIWQGHFGDGLVRTPDNYGRLGERPSNPELLDYLAKTFIENGWSIKKMNRMIMLSKTYQMSAVYDEATKAKDPENRLLSHFPRQRLSIEEIRDAYLAMGGDLDLHNGRHARSRRRHGWRNQRRPHQHESREDESPQHLSAAAPLQPADALYLVRFWRCYHSRRAPQPDHRGHASAVRDE